MQRAALKSQAVRKKNSLNRISAWQVESVEALGLSLPLTARDIIVRHDLSPPEIHCVISRGDHNWWNLDGASDRSRRLFPDQQ